MKKGLNKTLITLAIAALSTLALTVSASAATEITDAVLDNEDYIKWTKEGSPYIIKNDLTIKTALEVDYGTEIIVNEGKKITIEGSMATDWDLYDRYKYGDVKITSDTLWKGIEIVGDGYIEGEFDISKAEIGITSIKENEESISLSEITLHDNKVGLKVVGDCTIGENQYGIMSNCGLYNNDIGAILDCTGFEISECRVGGNRIGIQVLNPDANVNCNYLLNNSEFGIKYDFEDEGLELDCYGSAFYNNGKNIYAPNNSVIYLDTVYFKDVYNKSKISESIDAPNKDSLDIDTGYAILENEKSRYFKDDGSDKVWLNEYFYDKISNMVYMGGLYHTATDYEYYVKFDYMAPIDMEVVIVIYKDNRVVKCERVDMSKYPNVNNMISIPEGMDNLQVFIWDSFDTLTPVINESYWQRLNDKVI